MNNREQEYNSHQVFHKINEYKLFYERLIESLPMYLAPLEIHKKGIMNFDWNIFISIKATLESIELLLKAQHISDAIALIRKYYDASMISIYIYLVLDDRSQYKVHNISNIGEWFAGKKKIPEYRMINEYVKKHKTTKFIFALLEAKADYKKIREICNSNTHYNDYRKYLSNIGPPYFFYDKQEHLNFCLAAIKFLFIQHVSCIFIANPHFMRSSDYVDYLDLGETPPEGSEYWVSPFIVEMFDTELKTDFTEIYTLIKDCSEMQL